jgi:hypothetical protein
MCHLLKNLSSKIKYKNGVGVDMNKQSIKFDCVLNNWYVKQNQNDMQKGQLNGLTNFILHKIFTFFGISKI